LILLITNDAWFGPAAGPEQHLVQSQLRALEQGLPVVRVANTGITAMIDARGQITARLPMNEQGHLDAVLPPQTAVRPLFATYGELPILLIVLISTGLGIAAMPRNRIDQANGGR
jgi:apolipoprotein N-acyltransferase